jgi:hypothetical protein
MQYTEFPKFVPDQLLTSEHLNQVFNYLDEQDRLTRVCLIGIGIVCGLEVRTNNAGTSITISKGCGVTSEGYLVEVPETTYTEYAVFDPVKERYYDRFVDTAAKTKKFDLFELVQAGVIEESVPLTNGFIGNKVVLLFVELLEESNKNCDPNSCDNKGVKVTVTFRPLLVSKTNADNFLLADGDDASVALPEAAFSLTEMRMKRFDVPATTLLDSAAVFEAFLKAMDEAFFKQLEETLSKTFGVFGFLVQDVYPSNPFAGLVNRFRFLWDKSLTASQLLHVQYYYDLFSDVLLSYEELRIVGRRLLGVCCPNIALFPRHLLLGEAQGFNIHVHSEYRHYFIPSPILAQQSQYQIELRSLQLRLVLLLDTFLVPNVPKTGGKLPAEFVRITPSKLGEAPLSKRAIPYYYEVKKGTNHLYKYWDSEKTQAQAAHTILSYHAASYNSSDEWVRKPLLYDFEPNNFLRVEGHIGQRFRDVLKSVTQQRSKYRLPLDVIGLSTDTRSLRTFWLAGRSRTSFDDLISSADRAEIMRSDCHFHDLDALYATMVDRLVCFLCKELKYYYALQSGRTESAAATGVPTAKLLRRCDPAFRYKPSSFGEQFENWYRDVGKGTYLPAGTILSSSGYSAYRAILVKAAPGTAAAPTEVNLQAAVTGQLVLLVMYYIEMLSQTLGNALSTFSLETFEQRFNDLQKVASTLKEMAMESAEKSFEAKTEEAMDHLEKLIYACRAAELRALVLEFERRLRMVMALRMLAYYSKKCPGLQHKAGVPIGGTFIIVYHETSAEAAEAGPNVLLSDTFLVDTTRPQPAQPILTKSKKATPNQAVLIEAGTRKDAAITIENQELVAIINQLEGRKSSLDNLVLDIEDGTVIADFYLPFICCSDCPPIQFVVAPERTPPTEVSITIEPTEFCGKDDRAVPIKAEPPAGELTGDGVRPATPSGFEFVPVLVPLGDVAMREVELTYRLGEQSATAKVNVYHEPVLEFRWIFGAAPGTVVIVNSSKFAPECTWDFGDKTAPVTGLSPTHQYQRPGSYPVVLTAKNGLCSATLTQTIPVQIEQVRTCISISALAEEFAAFPRLQTGPFAAFRRIYRSYEQIDAYFRAFTAAGAMSSVEAEIKFHAEAKVISLLPGWLEELNVLIMQNVDLRLLGVALYRILARLIMRIACFQNEDIDVAKLPTIELFSTMQRHVKPWSTWAPTAPDPIRTSLKGFLESAQNELIRLKGAEAAQKPNYARSLDVLINGFKPLRVE